MLQMTVQGRYKFLGVDRTPGEVISSQELFQALKDGRTTMVAVNALKNRQLAILEDDNGAIPADGDRLGRLERSVALIAQKLGVEIEPAPEAVSAKPKKATGKKASAA